MCFWESTILMPESSSTPDFVLVISLGPVQDFIASARRCRDLWFGSWILSELSKAAALAIAEPNGQENLIFPPLGANLQPNSSEAVANKIIALAQNPQAAAATAESAARRRLELLAEATFARFAGKIALSNAQSQIRDLLEWNWAAAPLGEGGFAVARRRAEAVLAARKATRCFHAVGSWAGNAPKSSFDGQRESVVLQFPQDEKSAYEIWGARRGERLCGVALLKRQGQRQNQDSRVASTSHIAAQGLLERWSVLNEAETGRRAIQNYENALQDAQIPRNAFDSAPRESRDEIFGLNDGHLLFPNRLAEFFGDQTQAQSAQKALKDLLRDLNNDQNIEPHPYYALIVADGDKMGASISKAASPAQNQDLSAQLSLFAQNARATVEAQRGTLVYAGGDDVLALLPLHRALDTARELSTAFRAVFQTGVLDEWLHDKPTLSLGMAIVHHLEPLSEALALARAAEKSAKAVEGKNALAITLAKRSGSELTIADHWSQETTGLDGLDGRLRFFIRWADELPTGLAYEWRDLTQRLSLWDEAPDHNEDINAKNQQVGVIWQAEALRILERKRERGGKRELNENDALNSEMRTLLQNAQARNPQRNWLAELAGEMMVARELVAAQNIAKP